MSEYGRQDWSKVSANPIVDWGGLTKGFSEQLATQEQARIAKRKEIDDNTSTALKDLQNYTVGNNANVNSVITSGSDAYTTLLKNQYDQVKKGLADPRQFQLLLKNSQDSFGYLKKVGETWNQRADELQKRSNEGVNSLIEIEKAKLDAGLEQFQNVRIMPNSDGQMYMYHNNDDGSVNKSIPPTSISSLLNPANTKVDKVDVSKETAPVAKTIADYIKRTGSRTLGEFTNDPRNHTKYQEFVDGAANTITATPIKTASVLVDGMGYKTAWTEEQAKADPNAVYMKMVNGVMTPQITDAQKKAASEHIKGVLDSQITYEEKQQYQPERPQIVKAPKGEKGPKVDKQKEPYIAEKLSYINETPINSVTKKPYGKRKNVGYAVGVSNVKLNKAPGVDEVINGFGIKNGKFFIKYMEYSGKEKLGSTGYSETNVVKTPKEIYDDKNNSEIEAKIRLIPNPYTGENFHSSDEAKEYMNMLKGGNSKYMG